MHNIHTQLRLIVLSMVSLLSQGLYSQHLGGKVGYVYQQSSYIEGGLIVYENIPFFLGNTSMGFYALDLGGEFRIGGHHFVMGPKTAVEMYAGPLALRVGLSYLTDFKQGAFNWSPEIGITEAGLWYVMAGYNWTFRNRDFWDVTGFRLSVGMHIRKT